MNLRWLIIIIIRHEKRLFSKQTALRLSPLQHETESGQKEKEKGK